MFEKLLKWDQDTLIYLNGLGSEKSDLFWLITTNFITWIPLFLFIIILLFQTYNQKEFGGVALCYISMLVILTIVILITKEGVERLRPVNDTSINQLLRIVRMPTDYSFFSGHAASSFSIITMTVLFLRKRIKWIGFLFLWPLLFSFSRMYLGVHYPLDILVGCLVGVVFAWILYRIFNLKLRLKYST